MTGSGAGGPDRPPRLAPVFSEQAPVYSVGQVSDLLGVQQAFLRRLDEFGVVSPARTDGGQRRYSQNEVRRVSDVVGMVDEGITLIGVQRILDLQDEVRELHEQLRAEQARRKEE